MLSDPYCDHGAKYLAELLATPDDHLDWAQFASLLAPYLPAGTYEETAYFLPLALDYIRRHDDEALDLITPIIGYISLNADELEADRVLSTARDHIQRLLAGWTGSFQVQHFSAEVCRAKGMRRRPFDVVRFSAVVSQAVSDLTEFKRHADLGEGLILKLAHHDGDPARAAWFLELARSQHDGWCRLPADSTVRIPLNDPALLESAAEVVLSELVDSEPSPTYWSNTFSTLGF